MLNIRELHWLKTMSTYRFILLGVKLNNRSTIRLELLAVQILSNVTQGLRLDLESCGRLGLGLGLGMNDRGLSFVSDGLTNASVSVSEWRVSVLASVSEASCTFLPIRHRRTVEWCRLRVCCWQMLGIWLSQVLARQISSQAWRWSTSAWEVIQQQELPRKEQKLSKYLWKTLTVK